MNIKDIKFLWGHSGNRCAFPDCRIELATSGDPSIIGEIAHIIAKKKNGPRGDSSLPLEKRDEYSNLILLCPTHHAIIDSKLDKWTVKKLHKIKSNHEEWVSKQLDRGTISFPPIDNTKFLEAIKQDWINFASNLSWFLFSLTPLNIQNDVINPLNESIVRKINNIKIPEIFRMSYDKIVNQYETRPNENGIINESLEKINNGIGYRIQLYRNGHMEFLMCLENSLKSITNKLYEDNQIEIPDIKIFRYTDIAQCVTSLSQTMKKIWEDELPFNNMLLTTMILNTKKSKLYSYEKEFQGGVVFGNLVESNYLEYNTVLDKKMISDEIIELILNRFINYFGLVIDKICDNKGNYIRPDLLYKKIL